MSKGNERSTCVPRAAVQYVTLVREEFATTGADRYTRLNRDDFRPRTQQHRALPLASQLASSVVCRTCKTNRCRLFNHADHVCVYIYIYVQSHIRGIRLSRSLLLLLAKRFRKAFRLNVGILDKRVGSMVLVAYSSSSSSLSLCSTSSWLDRFPVYPTAPAAAAVAPSDIEQIRSFPSSYINQLDGLDAVLASQPINNCLVFYTQLVCSQSFYCFLFFLFFSLSEWDGEKKEMKMADE